MKFFSTLQHKFGFTASEGKVILFLAFAFIVGTGIRWLKPVFFQDAEASTEFDYSSLDKEFFERSKRIPELTSAPSVTSPDSALPESSTKTPASPSAATTIINLNTATKQDLMRLPGIGEKYAERIIMYREDNGPFASVDQLERVKGIGKKKIEQLRSFITVSDKKANTHQP